MVSNHPLCPTAVLLMTSRVFVEPLVKGVSGANHKGFNNLRAAKAAYAMSYLLGYVKARPSRTTVADPANLHSIVDPNPGPDEVEAILAEAAVLLEGGEWYAVFKGILTGIFPCW